MRELNRKNIPWDVNALAKKIKDKTAIVDSTSQRGLVWDMKEQMEIIESLIYNVNVGAITCNKKENIFSIIDGQQRGDTVSKFLNNELRIKGIEPLTLDDGTAIELEGKTFAELPKVLQDKIKKRSLVVYYYENLTPEEEAFVIKKINGGKPMTSIERAFIGAKSYPVFKELKAHPLFEIALTQKAMNRSVYAEIIVKTWIVLYGDNLCFDKNVFEPTMEKVDITNEQKQQIEKIYNRILEVYNILADRKENKRQNKKAAKLMLKKIHLLSLIKLISKTIEEDTPIEVLSDWILYFFSGEDQQATISSQYNENIKGGTGHAESIRLRLDAINKAWLDFNEISENSLTSTGGEMNHQKQD